MCSLNLLHTNFLFFPPKHNQPTHTSAHTTASGYPGSMAALYASVYAASQLNPAAMAVAASNPNVLPANSAALIQSVANNGNMGQNGGCAQGSLPLSLATALQMQQQAGGPGSPTTGSTLGTTLNPREGTITHITKVISGNLDGVNVSSLVSSMFAGLLMFLGMFSFTHITTLLDCHITSNHLNNG